MIFILPSKDNYLYLHRGFKCNLGDKYTKIIESMAKVLVEHGEVAKLARLFGIARKTVSEALRSDQYRPRKENPQSGNRPRRSSKE